MDSRYKERTKIYQEQENRIQAFKDKVTVIENGKRLKPDLTLTQVQQSRIKNFSG